MGANPSLVANASRLARLKETSSFSDEELRSMLSQYNAVNGTSRGLGATKENFCALLQPYNVTKRLSERLFHAFDEDGSGDVSFDEFVRGMEQLCRGKREDRIAFAFALYDVDGDGFVELAEVRGVMKILMRQEEKLVEFEARQSGTHLVATDIAAEEVSEEEGKMEELEDAFIEADIDNDGVLSYDEFKQFANHNEMVTEFLSFFPLEHAPASGKDGAEESICFWALEAIGRSVVAICDSAYQFFVEDEGNYIDTERLLREESSGRRV